MSKSLKMITGIVASIAIPFAAPALAGMMLASTASALATTATSAAIGAGLGAASAGITGADVGKGALFGGLGGGLAGYGSAASQAAKVAQGAGSTPAAGMGIMPLAPTATAPVGTGTVLAGPTSGGLSTGLGGAAGGGAPAGLSTLGSPAGAPVGTNTVLRGVQPPPAAGPAFDTGQYLAGITGTPGVATSQAPATFGTRVKEGLGNAWDEATSPGSLGRMATSTAKYLGTSALVGSGLDPQQEALVREQRQEMRRAQQANEQTNAIRTEQGLKLIREADYYDPEYMGLQRARQEQLRGARLKQAGVRGLTGPAASSEARRFDLGTSRNTGSAYDTGYQGGVHARTSTRAAGVGLLPNSYPQSDYTNINATYQNNEAQRRGRQQDAGAFVSELFTDPKDEDEKRRGGP